MAKILVLVLFPGADTITVSVDQEELFQNDWETFWRKVGEDVKDRIRIGLPK